MQMAKTTAAHPLASASCPSSPGAHRSDHGRRVGESFAFVGDVVIGEPAR